MPYETKVTLVGTWERKDTSSDEVSFARRLVRSDAAEARGIRGYLTARHPLARGVLCQRRRGDFSVVVDVSAHSKQYGTQERQLVARATAILKWFLMDNFCRPAQLTVDRSKSSATRRFISTREVTERAGL